MSLEWELWLVMKEMVASGCIVSGFGVIHFFSMTMRTLLWYWKESLLYECKIGNERGYFSIDANAGSAETVLQDDVRIV